jgi:cholesterol transport system auxiliary component
MRVKSLARVAVLAGLMACVGGPAPRDHFYRLEVPPPAATRSAPALSGALEIDRPTSDDLVRGRGVLYSESAGAAELSAYGFQLWVDSPTLLIQRQLADWLRQAGAADPVALPEAGADEAWRVSGHLEHFEHVVASDVVLVQLQLRLTDARNSRLVFQKVYRAEAPVAGPGPAGAVPAFGVALRAIFERFDADLAAAS